MSNQYRILKSKSWILIGVGLILGIVISLAGVFTVLRQSESASAAAAATVTAISVDRVDGWA